MVSFSNDVDILKYEPILFGELYLPWFLLRVPGGPSVEQLSLLQAPILSLLKYRPAA